MNLLQGTLDLLVLKALVLGPRHGYEVARWVRDTTHGTLHVDDGALYTALHRLEKRKLVQARVGGRRDRPAREVLLAHARGPVGNGERDAGVDELRRRRIQDPAGSRGSMSQRLPRGIRRLFRLGDVERDLDEELSSYFAHTVEELCGRGYTQAQAEQEAHRRFGDESRYRSELRAIDADRERGKQLSARFDALRESVTTATRSWRRSPAWRSGSSWCSRSASARTARCTASSIGCCSRRLHTS